jgi:Ser/Thr protein kinase RdoA (MazF antagonist)
MTLESLLGRTTLDIPFSEFLANVTKRYPTIGVITKYEPIFEGYEDANIIIYSETGKYVLKIFLKERSPENIYDYARVIKEATNAGVKTLEIIPGSEGDISSIGNTSVLITKYFEGINFQNTTPSLEDMTIIAGQIARLNTLDFPVVECYDSWGNKNLTKEFYKIQFKDKKIKEKIKPLVEFLEKQDISGFSRSVIHGDLQRKHVLKDRNEFCLIDFGCMSYDLKIYEVSTFLAWFCLAQDTWNMRDEIFIKVLSEYTKVHKLTEDETKLLKPLTAAAYASYFLITSKMIEDGDTSKETADWNNSAKEMFDKALNWAEIKD